MSVNNLEERIRALQMEAQKETDQELKKSLQEGRLKLEQALKRSLENEQRLLKFEYEIEQKTKQLNQMENLLQVRDGLIGMIKTKKDELTLENESLNEYAEQVRTLLIQVVNVKSNPLFPHPKHALIYFSPEKKTTNATRSFKTFKRI